MVKIYPFGALIKEVIKEVYVYLKEAISLTPKISISDQFIKNVVKPIANILATVQTTVTVFYFSFFLGITTIIDRFITNQIKPFVNIITQSIFNVFSHSLETSKPSIADGFIQNVLITYTPTLISRIELSFHGALVMATKLTLTDSVKELQLHPDSTILSSVVMSVDKRKSP